MTNSRSFSQRNVVALCLFLDNIGGLNTSKHPRVSKRFVRHNAVNLGNNAIL